MQYAVTLFGLSFPSCACGASASSAESKRLKLATATFQGDRYVYAQAAEQVGWPVAWRLVGPGQPGMLDMQPHTSEAIRAGHPTANHAIMPVCAAPAG
jgi:hypothetical protein